MATSRDRDLGIPALEKDGRFDNSSQIALQEQSARSGWTAAPQHLLRRVNCAARAGDFDGRTGERPGRVVEGRATLRRVAQEGGGQVADGAAVANAKQVRMVTSTGRRARAERDREGDTTVHIDFTSCGHQSSQGLDRSNT